MNHKLRQALPSGLSLTVWAYLYISIVLAAWMLMIWVLTPWTPVVMTSGSMSPAIRSGDIVFLAPATEEAVGQRTIVSFNDETGNRITHRVFAVNNDGYVTKGDANTAPDTRTLSAEDITGIGRFVIPFIGLPVLWWSTGAYAPLFAWAASFVLAVTISARRTGERRFRTEPVHRPGSQAARKAIRRVRVLVAFIIATHFLLDPNPVKALGATVSPLIAIVISSFILIAGNLLSKWSENPPASRLKASMPLIELVVDSLLVVALTAVTGTSGVGWVLFALPVVESAVRFGLAGGLIHWIGLSASTIGVQIWISERAGKPASTQLETIKDIVNQLSILLLLALPAAFLAEQLVSDVGKQRIATARARKRGQTLEQVVELGRSMVRLDRSLFDSLAAAGLELGFDRADVVARADGQSEWKILAYADSAPEGHPFPLPGEPASGLRIQDLSLSAAVIDADDSDPSEVGNLAHTGWKSLARLSLPGFDSSVVALRVGSRSDNAIDANRVEALQLLIVQASVGLGNTRLMTELKEMNLRVQHEATHDQLTGLPNRSFFIRQLEQAVGAIEPGRGVGLLFMDLNGFKPVNDRLGHEAGDELLQHVAQRMLHRSGGDVFVARLGGDEFTVLIRNLASAADAQAVANRMIGCFEDPFVLEQDQVKISSSVGVSFSDTEIDPSELLRRADTAMYRAKRESAGTILHYTEFMDSDERRWAQLLAELESSFDTNIFEIHYQPVMDARAQAKVVGVEALIRWTHPELGNIQAPDIMLLAEKSGRAAQLLSWIITQGCLDLAELQRLTGHEALFLALNASPTELSLPGLAETVLTACTRAQLPIRSIMIEINENLLAQPSAAVADNLDQLVQLGVQLLLDDFGQGQTSFGHMRHLPLAGVKLDRAIVQLAAINRSDRIVMKGIASMAHELGMTVIAEGVETAAEVAAATHCGVDMLQGFYFAQPVPIHEFRTWLADTHRPLPPPSSPGMVKWLAN